MCESSQSKCDICSACLQKWQDIYKFSMKSSTNRWNLTSWLRESSSSFHVQCKARQVSAQSDMVHRNGCSQHELTRCNNSEQWVKKGTCRWIQQCFECTANGSGMTQSMNVETRHGADANHSSYMYVHMWQWKYKNSCWSSSQIPHV